MGLILSVLGGICGLAAFVCFILVVIKFFTNGDTMWGVLSIILIFCGIGYLVALIGGWLKVGEYNMQTLMLAFTGTLIGAIILNVAGAALTAPN